MTYRVTVRKGLSMFGKHPSDEETFIKLLRAYLKDNKLVKVEAVFADDLVITMEPS